MATIKSAAVPRFKTMWNQHEKIEPPRPLSGQIVTRPGQSLTIEETMVRFGQHGAIRQNQGYHYYDDTLGTDTSKLSFEELHDYAQKVAAHARTLQQAAQAKAAQDREAEILEAANKKYEEIRQQEAATKAGQPVA